MGHAYPGDTRTHSVGRKRLEIALERLEGFGDPSPELEQYGTPSHLASALLDFASNHDDVKDKDVVDLGCGTGILTVGSALIGGTALGVDIDPGSVRKARKNAGTVGVVEDTEFICGDVSQAPIKDGRFDTVVMNPPFGAQKKGADRPFLRTAGRTADVAYSIHNSGSLDFVEGFVDGEVTDAFETTVRLKNSFGFHQEGSREIEVELYRILL